VIASGSSHENCSIKVWNVNDGACLLTLKEHDGTITALCLLGEDLLASASADTTIRVWLLKKGKSQKTLHGHRLAVLGLARMDAEQLASCSDDCTVIVWNWPTASCLRRLTGHRSWVRQCLFLREFDALASGGGEGAVLLQSLKSQEVLHSFRVH